MDLLPLMNPVVLKPEQRPFAVRDAQLNWLKKDLASVNRKKTPWIVVGMFSMRFSYDMLVISPPFELL